MNLSRIYSFPSDAHTTGLGIHTFDIVDVADNDSEYRYLGYAGPVHEGAIDIWGSDDLVAWSQLPESPILEEQGIRWASVVRDDGGIWLAVRNTNSKLRRGIDYLLTLNNRLASFPFSPVGKMRIDLYRSTDGLEFDFVETIVSAKQTGGEYNRNPFIWKNPANDQIGLVYYSDDLETGRILYREAPHPPKLQNADDTLLVESKEDVVAAPALSYEKDSDEYILWVESINGDGDWTTDRYRTGSVDSYVSVKRERIFDNNIACPFPFRTSDNNYLFVSHCTESVPEGTIDAPWEGQLFTYQ